MRRRNLRIYRFFRRVGTSFCNIYSKIKWKRTSLMTWISVVVVVFYRIIIIITTWMIFSLTIISSFMISLSLWIIIKNSTSSIFHICRMISILRIISCRLLMWIRITLIRKKMGSWWILPVRKAILLGLLITYSDRIVGLSSSRNTSSR